MVPKRRSWTRGGVQGKRDLVSRQKRPSTKTKEMVPKRRSWTRGESLCSEACSKVCSKVCTQEAQLDTRRRDFNSQFEQRLKHARKIVVHQGRQSLKVQPKSVCGLVQFATGLQFTTRVQFTTGALVSQGSAQIYGVGIRPKWFRVTLVRPNKTQWYPRGVCKRFGSRVKGSGFTNLMS